MVSRFKHYNVIHFLVRALILVLAALAVLYIYFLCSSIRNVVLREELEQGIASLSSSIGELEAHYFTLQSAVDKETAHRLGMVDIESKIYAPRFSAQSNVTLNQ